MQTERDPAECPPHEMPAEDRPRQPPSYELRTRDRLSLSPLGAMTRFRSWATVFVGVVALAICLAWLFWRWD